MRQRAVWLGGLLAALMAFGSPARAQETPTRAARSFFDALAEHRWRDAAMFVHPLRRASFQEEELAVLVAWAESEQARRLDAQSGTTRPSPLPPEPGPPARAPSSPDPRAD